MSSQILHVALFALLALTPASNQELQMIALDDGTEMSYAVAVPAGYDGSEPVPLVLALHYGWSGPSPEPGYGRDFLQLLVRPALGALDAIIVAPDCPGRNWANERSESAVLALLEHIRSEHTIDPDRIVVTGFSLGGIGTWYMASRHPEIFRAAVPMAGRPSADWIEGVVGVPLYIIHSRQDEVVPIAATEEAVATLRVRGSEVELIVLDGVGHYQTRAYVPYLRNAVAWLKRVLEEQ